MVGNPGVGIGKSGTMTTAMDLGSQSVITDYTFDIDDISITCTSTNPVKEKEEKPKVRSGRCRRCGEWASDLGGHEKKGCRGRFRK